LKYWIEST